MTKKTNYYSIKYVMEVTNEVEAHSKSEAMEKFNSGAFADRVNHDVGNLYSYYEEYTLALSDDYKDEPC